MKTKNKVIDKEFDTVKTFRAIKSKISDEIKDMSFEQLSIYLNKEKFKDKI